MSRLLITGATGFLGHHLVTLLRQRDHEVIALCRRSDPTPAGSQASPRLLEAEGVIVRHGDVLDAASVRAAAEGCTALLHCAGKVSRKPEDAEEPYRLHVEGTKITLDACRAAGVTRVVLASTSGVVAVTKEPGPRWGLRPHTPEVPNEDAATPIDIIARWPYYRSKL